MTAVLQGEIVALHVTQAHSQQVAHVKMCFPPPLLITSAWPPAGAAAGRGGDEQHVPTAAAGRRRNADSGADPARGQRRKDSQRECAVRCRRHGRGPGVPLSPWRHWRRGASQMSRRHGRLSGQRPCCGRHASDRPQTAPASSAKGQQGGLLPASYDTRAVGTLATSCAAPGMKGQRQNSMARTDD